MPARVRSRHTIDALGREVPLPTQAQHIVVMLNDEEFAAIGGVDAWQRVVGMNRASWEVARAAIFAHDRTVPPSLAALPDIGSTEQGMVAAETLIALRLDPLSVPTWA